jgi:hypothetical protein
MDLTPGQLAYLEANPFPWEWATGGDETHPGWPFIWVDHGCVQQECACFTCNGHKVIHRAGPGWNVTVDFATPDMKMEPCHMCNGTGRNEKLDIWSKPLVDRDGKVVFNPALFVPHPT